MTIVQSVMRYFVLEFDCIVENKIETSFGDDFKTEKVQFDTEAMNLSLTEHCERWNTSMGTTKSAKKEESYCTGTVGKYSCMYILSQSKYRKHTEM